MLSLTNNHKHEIVFSVASEEELVKAFRLRDQKKLIVPEGLRYPFNVRSYFTWKEPSGVYTYLVFQLPNWDRPRGVAFKRTPSTGEPTGGLCNWCHAYGSSEDIGMLSVAMSAGVSFSYFLCQDLRCIEKIEEASMLAGKDPSKNISTLYHRMEKLFENISNYKPD
jgi:treble-clef zinc-finger protein